MEQPAGETVRPGAWISQQRVKAGKLSLQQARSCPPWTCAGRRRPAAGTLRGRTGG
ncbi:hypothetical protein MRQ86_28990 [Streptomyces sp. MMS21 TC-5]|uniref:hypothetical protein n=1 Tax=Streptomyces TaxID=1883 RepID=UPI001F3B1BC8|nr:MULTISPECIES: hypothetical protein [unclassified Streptomyces]MCI4084276.1 hypothetical protein [Streptomyces sp. MMS21 TC-5]